jgi:hypothetical protein
VWSSRGRTRQLAVIVHGPRLTTTRPARAWLYRIRTDVKPGSPSQDCVNWRDSLPIVLSQDSPCRVTPLAAVGRKARCITSAVISRGARPQGWVLTVMTPSTDEESDRKDGCHGRRQPTHEVQAARRELTVLATVDKQCVRLQSRVQMCRQSTARAWPQGKVQSASTGSSEPTTG